MRYMKGGGGDGCPVGLTLDELGKGLTRSHRWSGFVRKDTRALAAEEDERRIRLSCRLGGLEKADERGKERAK